MRVSTQQDGVENYAAALFFIVADTVAVVLRAIAKWKTKRSVGSDDIWMLIALAFFYVWAGLIIYSVLGISGTLEITQIPDLAQISELTKTLYVASPFLPLTITPLKISILCFYRSVFPLRWFRTATYILTTLCVLWLFSGFWVTIFQCTPVRAVYDFSASAQLNAKCLDFGQFVFIYELLNACIDVAILALPAFVVPGLHLPLRQRIQVMAIFLMGGFVLVTCVLRMVYSYNPKNPKAVPSYSKGVLWSTIELGTAIVCGNLPTYRALFPNTPAIWPVISSWYSSIRGTLSTKSGSSTYHSSFSKRSDRQFDNEDETRLTKISGPSRADTESSHSYALNSIVVDSRFEVTSSRVT